MFIYIHTTYPLKLYNKKIFFQMIQVCKLTISIITFLNNLQRFYEIHLPTFTHICSADYNASLIMSILFLMQINQINM